MRTVYRADVSRNSVWLGNSPFFCSCYQERLDGEAGERKRVYCVYSCTRTSETDFA